MKKKIPQFESFLLYVVSRARKFDIFCRTEVKASVWKTKNDTIMPYFDSHFIELDQFKCSSRFGNQKTFQFERILNIHDSHFIVLDHFELFKCRSRF